jgi:hypothetical protein
MSLLRVDDIRFATRRLRKNPGAPIASVAALACGIGAATAAWSLISAVLVPGHSYPEVEAIPASAVFDGIAAGGIEDMLVTEEGGVPSRREVYFAGHDFFATLGIRAALGRTFAENEDRRGGPPVAVLSDRYWRLVFHADPNVLSGTVTVSATPATIIGVLPPGFRGLHLTEAPDLYLPLGAVDDIDFEPFNLRDPLGPRMAWLRVVGRLRPGDTPAAVETRLNAVPIDCPVCEQIRGGIGQFALTNVNTAAIPSGHVAARRSSRRCCLSPSASSG